MFRGSVGIVTCALGFHPMRMKEERKMLAEYGWLVWVLLA